MKVENYKVGVASFALSARPDNLPTLLKVVYDERTST